MELAAWVHDTIRARCGPKSEGANKRQARSLPSLLVAARLHASGWQWGCVWCNRGGQRSWLKSALAPSSPIDQCPQLRAARSYDGPCSSSMALDVGERRNRTDDAPTTAPLAEQLPPSYHPHSSITPFLTAHPHPSIPPSRNPTTEQQVKHGVVAPAAGVAGARARRQRAG